MDEIPSNDELPLIRPSSKDVNKAHQRSWRSEELFGASREILILHGDEIYRLRRTRNEKLILQK